MDETTALKKFDRLAHKLATYYHERSNGRYDYDDLYQAARLGILNAARTFNAEMGTEFITHAWNCARNSVKKAIRDDRGLIRVPVASETVITVVDSETASTLLEMQGSDADARASEQNVMLAQAMASIPERQREAVRLVYLEGLTYEEAAEQLDVSKQYAHQLTARGLDSLRSVLGDNMAQML